MNGKPVPGPWRVVKAGGVFCVVSPKNNLICRLAAYDHIQEKWDDAEATMNLIAAAHEMLEALKAFLRAPCIGSNGIGSVSLEVQIFNLDAARAAIAKAEGGE